MPLNLAYRGGAMLRTVRLNVLSRSARAAAIHIPAKRVSLAPSSGFSKLPVGVAYPSTALPTNLVNCYATSSGAEAGTGNSKASTASKAKKTSSKASRKTEEKTDAEATKKASQRKKKPLTEKQQKALEAKNRNQKIRELKEASLSRPKYLAGTHYNVAVQELAARKPSDQDMRTFYKEVSRKIESSSPEDQERWKATAESNKAANAEAYNKWLHSHTPLQIKEANVARRNLSLLTGRRIPLLQDERLVKQPVTAWILFVNERRSSGDYKDLKSTEISSRVAQEWKSLPEAEKQKYLKKAAEDRERYVRECKEIYGEVPGRASPRPRTKA